MEDPKARYTRHLRLPGFSEKSQRLLSEARVLVIGCGGLGHPVLQYLTASGAGTLGIVDSDTIQISNLHRQILFREKDEGLSKITTAAIALNEINSEVQFELHHTWAIAQNVVELLRSYDLIVDCSDNFATRYLLDDACGMLKKPLIHGSVYRYEGRVTLFHGINETSYRTVYQEPPESGEIPDCTEGGVLGSLTGITGSIMATEAIKWITEIGECLDGKMLIFDVMQMSFHTIMLPRVSEAADYQIRSSYEPIRTKKENQQMVQEITPTEFRELKSSGRKFTLIDVREPYEYEENNLGGILIPLHEIPQRHIEIPKDHQVVVHCRSGVRSAHAIEYLQKNFGYGNLMNLQGGILACLKNT